MRPSAGGFVIPLTFSNNAAWYQNVLAGGSCTVTYQGADHTVGEPEVIDFASAAPSFPRYERLQFQLIGINEFLRLTTVGEETDSKERLPMAIDTKTFRNTGVLAASPRRPLGLALAVIAMAQLMVVLDVAIVNVALPSIQHQLHFSAPDLEWVVNAYLIAFGGLLLLGGRTGDLFGRVRMFVIGLLLFTAGSLAGGLATTSTFLIVARAVQGIGGAIVAPTALSLLADTFSEGRGATAPWASTPRFRRRVARLDCCSAESSPTTSPGGGSCSSTCPSACSWCLLRRACSLPGRGRAGGWTCRARSRSPQRRHSSSTGCHARPRMAGATA